MTLPLYFDLWLYVEQKLHYTKILSLEEKPSMGCRDTTNSYNVIFSFKVMCLRVNVLVLPSLWGRVLDLKRSCFCFSKGSFSFQTLFKVSIKLMYVSVCVMFSVMLGLGGRVRVALGMALLNININLFTLPKPM